MLELLRGEIIRTAESLVDNSRCRETIMRALARPGFALHPESRCRAGVLSLGAYEAILGSLDATGIQAGAAVELQMNAAYMFDHVADQELDPDDGLSAAEELALAIAILTCGSAVASQAISKAKSRMNGLRALQEFHTNYIGACSGQYLDAYLEKQDISTTDEALNMTSRKSGSLGRYATTFGAGIATDDQEEVELFGEFGFNFFTYLQLIDDLRDACPIDEPMRDLMQHKKTVPLVFFYNYLAEERNDSSGDMMQRILSEDRPRKVRQEFERSGAKLFCAILAESFLNRAKDILAELRGQSYRVESLEQLVESVEIRPQEVLVA